MLQPYALNQFKFEQRVKLPAKTLRVGGFLPKTSRPVGSFGVYRGQSPGSGRQGRHSSEKLADAVQDRYETSTQGLALSLMLRLDIGPLAILIASLLAEHTLVQLRFDSAGLHSLAEPDWLVDPPQGRGQLWARNPARSPTWWPTFPGVDGFHEDNGVSGIYPGWRRSGRQPPLVRCASA
jgi:hypothetical protein